MNRSPVILTGLAVLTLGLGCGRGPTAADSERVATVVTTVEQSNAVLFLAVPSGQVIKRVDLQARVEGAAISTDGRTLFLGTVGPGFQRDLLLLEVPSGREMRRIPLSSMGSPINIVDSAGVMTAEVIGATEQRDRIGLWRARKNGIFGAVLFDVSTGRPLSFAGPLNVAAGGIVTLTANSRYPDGAVAVIAGRENAGGGPRTNASIYILNRHTFEIIDSLTTLNVPELLNQNLWRIIPTRSGTVLYILTNTQIVKYDLTTSSVVGTARNPAQGSIVLTPDETRLIVTDGGTWPDFPGSGLLYVFDQSLHPISQIDVSTPIGGRPNSPTATRTGLAVSSLNGDTLYVRAGSDAIGPLYPVQPARLLVVDLRNATLVRAIELTGDGLGQLFLSTGRL